MTVIAEFSLPAEEFLLGDLLQTTPDVRIRLERVVPTGAEVMPYVWVRLEDERLDAFERVVNEDPLVGQLARLDSVDDETLYAVEWESPPESLFEGVVRSEGAILRGGGAHGRWEFIVRFPDHDRLRAFHEYLDDHGITVSVDRVYTLSEDSETPDGFDLTETQRETLRTAVRRGYFEVPRRVTATDLAEELGVTPQAVSERIRRATNSVLNSALFTGEESPTGDDRTQ
ncbi:helix-turn-helix domain-containing protein [Salinirubellus salinus]|uniref:Helix-turn-helix domain-containing protein n=1 Tax=Salinirubellus salinus TaxID=1364945 RepID=A0A9E7UBE6_9EURY|nr:helix-turn-helix domain-containing protein [Salinirubellus salinus]UWM55113.1 helix-turn-helix domain-containing protein [Salinirubellus salinus]